MMFTLKRILFLLTLVVLTGATVSAQDFRGAISGRVTEASGAAVNNAVVTVTNIATNAASNTTTNDSGEYSALYLTPGQYKVSVEAKGFKKSLRQNVEVRIGDKLALDVQLEVGAVQETVNITSDAPLLETNSASAGQVIDQRRIADLPLSDGNPFVLSRLSPGIAYVGDLKFSRPFDNSGAAAVIADGAPGRNEFTLDGIPNMASGGGTNGAGRVAFVPPAEATQEFKVETASYDGQQSHTAAATVNVALKSGSNGLHGSVYEFVRNDVLSANDFFLNRTNLTTTPSRDKNKDGKADRDALHYNRYGLTVGGPILFPKKIFRPLAFDGRNRSFFFFAIEKLKDVFPEPANFTVPTQAERNGDFSALLPSIVIYDPATARAAAGGRVQRDPFQGNIIQPNRLNAIAKNYLQYYPLPNQPGDSQGRNNYISGQPRFDIFHSESYRFDQVLSDKQRFFVRYSHNWRRESRSNWTDVVNGIRPTGNYLFRINNGGSFDHLYDFGPTLVLNTRVGYTRFREQDIRQHGGFNPASLGFPAATAALFGPEQYLPRFDIGNFSLIGDSSGDDLSYNIYSFMPTLTKIAGKHSYKMGYDFRSYRENSAVPGNSAGTYTFRTDFTKGPLDNSAGAAIGQDLASFLLGRTTGGSIDRNTARSNQSLFSGMFLHDDWKATSKLTLNLGIRYEYEGTTTERYNRNVFFFDQTVASPIEAAAKTAYALAPQADVPASSFQVKGGIIFADKDHRSFYNPDKNNLQPRIGFAYKLTDKTVLRGGWGIYTVPFTINGVNQPGFSQQTPISGSNDLGLTFLSSLDAPFPNGVLAAAGASLGLSAQLGQGVTFLPRDVKNTQAQRWSFGVQRELLGNWLVEAQYVGNHGYSGVVGTNILNTTPKKYLSTSLFRDQAQIDANSFLTATVANPFRGLIPGIAAFNGATIARRQLLLPFPEFGTISTIRNDATSDYHSLQARVEKRFSKGFLFSGSYTWSKFLTASAFLNEADTAYERRLDVSDIPQRLVLSGIWELPFGKGRMFGANWNRWVNGVLGGWQFQGIAQLQSGTPLSIGNVYYNGDITKLKTSVKSGNIDGTLFDISGFYFTDAAVQTNGAVDPAKQRADARIALTSNYRVVPSRFAQFRGDNLNQWDLSVSKNLAVTEKIKFQLRGEFLNAFNTPNFGSINLTPNNSSFGKSTGQNNLARNVQIGLKLTF